ncbi:hypothetical protein [Okeania sp. SIO2C9]|uniref:hypothetical protein n=1 Tax=Okeania sp. SIO2C9 TaxID=2607791 RepID=UPI0025D8B9C3|nr:hypothetical protein [Okeania sp. SIO2C9]
MAANRIIMEKIQVRMRKQDFQKKEEGRGKKNKYFFNVDFIRLVIYIQQLIMNNE